MTIPSAKEKNHSCLGRYYFCYYPINFLQVQLPPMPLAILVVLALQPKAPSILPITYKLLSHNTIGVSSCKHRQEQICWRGFQTPKNTSIHQHICTESQARRYALIPLILASLQIQEHSQTQHYMKPCRMLWALKIWTQNRPQIVHLPTLALGLLTVAKNSGVNKP